MATTKTLQNWADGTVWTGDNLHIMRGMNSESVDLIYLDPPFNSNEDYAAPIGTPAEGAEFKDTWNLTDLDEVWLRTIKDEMEPLWYLLMGVNGVHSSSMLSYLVYMIPRLAEMKRLLKPTGSIYLHCDPTASHYLKTVMDYIFGRANFRNEIVWSYSGGGVPRKDFARKHDIILRYSKTDMYRFNVQYRPYADNTSTHSDGTPLDKERGAHMEAVWNISAVNSQSKERTGYPTQKPLSLLELIIKASSDRGDVVLDPFCGCATTCIAARRLERRWVGIDISPKAADLVDIRITQDEPLFQKGKCVRRSDVPKRTDLGDTPSPAEAKRTLYGKQEGFCRGCGEHFHARNLTLDHILARAEGGTDHLSNLQLLCGHCNSTKGRKSQEALMARLKELGINTDKAV